MLSWFIVWVSIKNNPDFRFSISHVFHNIELTQFVPDTLSVFQDFIKIHGRWPDEEERRNRVLVLLQCVGNINTGEPLVDILFPFFRGLRRKCILLHLSVHPGGCETLAEPTRLLMTHTVHIVFKSSPYRARVSFLDFLVGVAFIPKHFQFVERFGRVTREIVCFIDVGVCLVSWCTTYRLEFFHSFLILNLYYYVIKN